MKVRSTPSPLITIQSTPSPPVEIHSSQSPVVKFRSTSASPLAEPTSPIPIIQDMSSSDADSESDHLSKRKSIEQFPGSPTTARFLSLKNGTTWQLTSELRKRADVPSGKKAKERKGHPQKKQSSWLEKRTKGRPEPAPVSSPEPAPDRLQFSLLSASMMRSQRSQLAGQPPGADPMRRRRSCRRKCVRLSTTWKLSLRWTNTSLGRELRGARNSRTREVALFHFHFRRCISFFHVVLLHYAALIPSDAGIGGNYYCFLHNILHGQPLPPLLQLPLLLFLFLLARIRLSPIQLLKIPTLLKTQVDSHNGDSPILFPVPLRFVYIL